MVECQLPKLDVAGSSPVSRSISNDLGIPTDLSLLRLLHLPRPPHADSFCCGLRSTVASSFLTASRFCSKSELVYTSRLTPIPWPLWSEATFGSTPAFFDKLALVFRNTWNVAQSSPIFSSLGFMLRRQTLSADNGVLT